MKDGQCLSREWREKVEFRVEWTTQAGIYLEVMKIILNSMGGVGFLEVFGHPQLNLAGIRSSSWAVGTDVSWKDYFG